MKQIVISAQGLCKAYKRSNAGTGTLVKDFQRWQTRIRGKEDPYSCVDQPYIDHGLVWPLKNLNFEIAQGDRVAVTGKNGSGKSTLLKILSRITAPTSGKITGKGRIASLLEVGTGFHPELSGRENVFLNGAILGMRKAEIKRKFDEIIHFADVERYLESPVKRYSSGMYVRLAFAVAAHLDSEILLVDEILAVGDTDFQHKCLNKMRIISYEEGRTILFVSHNIKATQFLCNREIRLGSPSH